ncbi:type VI secretion system ATPase TssH [Bremerella alba]|uniref:Protein ClpV1 n=1 Tax=Bremerella alba TaxID=980252 RepID=A0A7V9A8E5_9BACT|nr:type VI secretion system ATPase TssH [Bremerella alba]MBA2116213.1 Protein ClpV1 [Bremerella alba]
MASVNLKSLVGKLNGTCRRTLEAAAGLCLSRTNYNVEIEHWLTKILETPNTDLDAIMRNYEIDPSKLVTELTRAMDKLKTGNARPPALSQTVVDLARDAWLLASVDYLEPTVRSGHLIIAMLSDRITAQAILSSCPELENISLEDLKTNLAKITAETSEEEESQASLATAPATGGPGGGPAKPTKTPGLDQFTIDLTEKARKGDIDPVLGRDDEIRQIVDILCRRRQNNPILTGEAGVGKTAVVEGFALRVAAEDVPDALKNVSIRTLDLALLQAGAGVKGEFENRLKSVIEEVKSSPKPVILFIDEAHTMIGAGGQAGQGDAANLLKPALARGELRTIAATTWAEYKKYFERDAALARRFQVVKVEEPSEEKCIGMMRGLVATLEHHHNVRILNEAVESAVKLSHRYISGRQLPDKAVSLLDTACARIGLSQNSTPPQIEHLTRLIDRIVTEVEILNREMASGAEGHEETIAQLEEQKKASEESWEVLSKRWEQEKELVNQIRELQDELAEDDAKRRKPVVEGEPKPETLADAKRDEIKQQVKKQQAELLEIQGETPLVHICCDTNAVAETVGAWTGIPVGKMVANEIATVLKLQDMMEESVVGQSHAMLQISESIKTSRANLEDPNRPIGIFLLAGTSGVGKTETALTLANLLYGGEQNMTTINMSEFKEEHKVSLLMGSPPGYVGYGEGGVLTEAVRRKPYSVILLDEMEKAHPGVQDIFYQVFDKGHMKDGEGRDIDFKNSVIIMTSNAGTDLIMSLCQDPETRPDPQGLHDALHEELLKTFKPAFLGRISIIPYFPLDDDVMKKIIRLKLSKVGRRVHDHYRATFDYSDALVDAIAARCTEVDTGARNVDKILTRTLLPEMSGEFLSRMAEGSEIKTVDVDVDKDGNFVYSVR